MIDRHSETWKAVEAWAQQRLSAAMTQLECEGTDLATTENVRGRIQELRGLLNFGNSRKIAAESLPIAT